jgi:hypothetical protein
MNREKAAKSILVMDLQELGCGDMDRKDVDQNKYWWRALVLLYDMICFEGGSSRSHYMEEPFWKRLWTCRKTEY